MSAERFGFPTSFAQERLLFLDRLEPESARYNLGWALALRGRLDRTALASAVTALTARHEALRTTFSDGSDGGESDAGPLQVIAAVDPDSLATPLPLVDLSGLPDPETRRAEALWLANQALRRPLDLARGPLARHTLLRLAAEEHALLLAIHHAVADAWSLAVLLRDLATLYTGAPLPELPLQYADFAVWQREHLTGEVLTRQLAYWRRRLAGCPGALDLPTDRPRPPVQTSRGRNHPVRLVAEETVALARAGRSQGSTLFMTLLAGFAALLGRYSGQEDLAVGSAMANRDQVELEGVVGLFANALALRVEMAGDPPFRELLARVRETTLGAAAHADLPFEKLVEELRPERDLSRTPLFQAAFDLHPEAAAEEHLFPGLSLTPLPLASGTAKFDLTLSLAERANGADAGEVAGILQFNSDLFEAATIARLLGHYEALLAGAAAAPELPLSALPLLRPWERRQLLVDWNATGADFPRDGSIHARFAERARATPAALAIVDGEARITYGELDARAGALARRLRAAGVGTETLVALSAARSIELVVAMLAVLKAGGAYVPLDPAYPRERLAYLLAESGAPVLLTEERLADTFPASDVRVILLDRADDKAVAEPTDEGAIGGAALAYVIYTSGSTGRPKGVAVPHRAVLRLVLQTDYVQCAPGDRVGQLANASFDAATFEIWGPLLNGGPLAILPQEVVLSPAALAAAIRRQGINTMFLTTALFNQMAREAPGAFAPLAALLFGGEAVDPGRVRGVLGDGAPRRLLHVYGPTESTTFATWFEVRAVAPEATTVPIGKPIANTRAYVLDAAFQPVPVGVHGSLYLGGDGLARGYLGRPELTAERFVPDPFAAEAGTEPGGRLYATGDRVRRRPGGDLEFLGRTDRQVKIRGFRVEPGEVEAVLARQEGVAQAAVIVDERVDDRQKGERRLVAYVVADAEHAGGDAESWIAALRAGLRAALPEAMVPAVLMPLPHLPLTANGKLDHRALPPAAAGARSAEERAAAPPRGAVEEILVAVWREVLELPAVGVDDNFFDLGGHSLRLARVHDRLRALLPAGRRPSMVDLFHYPTIAELAAHLATPEVTFETATAPSLVAEGHVGETAIAVIGMSGRFPGADSVAALWENLAAGVESIAVFTDAELAAAGIPAALFGRPDYVRARGLLAGADLLDAPFFGLTPREAELLDPQQRLLLESAWTALEDAGYPPEGCPERTGVFAGMSRNTYLRRIEARPELLAAVGELPAMMANHNDFLATRISYKLDLKGASVNVQSACSTSLLAVHLACRALLQRDCDLALAGGVSVKFPQRAGHLATVGGIISPDGHCRPFDAAAAGTVPGEGVAVVVLKRLADALADGDTVHAVIRGTAVNNDGAAKVGYTAPGIDGQAAAIAAAQRAAGVAPETIGYVEAHGTATPLGDPIEVAALAQAFGPGVTAGSCALGSVKGNFGHLDAAAGVTGLIKTVLALEHRQIPPSLHFERANPEIDLAATPFYVNTRLTDWRADGGPRRAGVSSFGMGGTNVHAVLEEASAVEPSGPSRPWQLLVLSARTPAALAASGERLRQHLEATPELAREPLADLAFTLRMGRRAFAHRRAIVCRDRASALATLAEPGRVSAGVAAASEGRPVAFLFPGQGAQRPGATAELYAAEAGYRERIDRCAELLAPALGLDLRGPLFSPAEAGLLARTEITQPALFAVEWSLAGLWGDWGVVPEAMLGHSLGEYVAACLAGVFSLADALALVAERGRLMQALPPGAMLAVPLGEAALAAHLAAEPELALAAVNGPERCVAAGSEAAIERLERTLAAAGIDGRRLFTSHAFHAPRMDAILVPFARRVGEIELRAPRIPYLSNLTGRWIRAEQATDPAYWAAHLRQTVRFGDALAELATAPARLLLEVGPGRTLGALARRRRGNDAEVFSPLAEEGAGEQAGMLAALGGLWSAGARVAWHGFQGDERRRRVPLPTYPFERQRHWIEDGTEARSTDRPTDEESVMKPTATEVLGGHERRRRLLAAVTGIFAGLLGVRPEELPAGSTFLELGADSLTLIQASRGVEESLGVRVPFRRLLEDLTTPAGLAGHLDAALPPDPPPAPLPSVASPVPVSPVATPTAPAETGAMADIAREHLRVMSRLLDLMGAGPGPAPTPPAAPPAPAITASAGPARPEEGAALPVFIPYQPVKTAPVAGLGTEGRRHVEALIDRYTARTPGSKRLAAADRGALADNRAVAGFRGLWKEMVYPIVARSSRGSRLVDVDGNEYVDLNMGYGVHLFGHSPEFLTRALNARLAEGIELGTRSALAGEVARGVCELTGMERVTFCATGTEAVMNALRAVRTVTRRSKVALFAGSYHGAFDGTLAKAGPGSPGGNDGPALPIAPGVLPGMVGDVMVLDYGSPRALERIAAHADELAAVLVEPVQSRRPDVQPADFLRALRRLTAERGVPLVFDEIVTGFRLHPAGAGGWFGVQPDLATYGKVLGGGLPIGLVAGRAAFLDAFDGGPWSFGDASAPEAELTFFASTFAQHPLSLAAAAAVLARLRAEGPALQERLNARAGELAARLDAEFVAAGVPLTMAVCGSILRILIPREVKHPELLYFHLVEKGIYAGHGRPMFVSTAHTDEDFDRVVAAVGRSVRELAAAGLLGAEAGPAAPRPHRAPEPRSLPLTEAQQQLWVLSRLDAAAAAAYNQSLTLHLSGPLDRAALAAALQDVVDRHEALRITFGADGDRQTLHPALQVPLPVTDAASWSAGERAARAAHWLDGAAREPFDLAAGPLVRARLLRQGEGDHLLALTIHHIVSDGWSFGIVLRDLAVCYGARRAGAQSDLPPPAGFSRYVEWRRSLPGSAEWTAAESYWLAQYAEPPAELALPVDRPRAAAPTYASSWERLEIDAATWSAVRAAGACRGATALATLLAVYQVLLHRLSGQRDFAVGVPLAGQGTLGVLELVGYCVELLPLRLRLDPAASFAVCLAAAGRQLLDAQEHHAFPFGALIERLGLPRTPGRQPLVRTTFNLDRLDPRGSFALPGTGVEVMANPSGASDFDLDLNLVESRGGLTAHLDFSAALFEPATVRRWLGAFATLLGAIAGGGETPVAALPLLTAAERAEVLALGNAVATVRPHGVGIHQLVAAAARRDPEALAVRQEDEILTYRELLRRAHALAERLQRQGVRAETPVALCLERSPLAAVSLLGILAAGGAYLPLDPALPQERLDWMLRDAGAGLVLTTSDLALRFAGGPAAPLALDTLDFGTGTGDGGVAPVDDASLAYVLYTSGSTGRPKGVLVSHGALVNHALAVGRRYELAPADRAFQFASLAFDVAAEELFATWVAGGAVVLRSEAAVSSIPAFVDEVAREGVTVLNLPGSFWHEWVDQMTSPALAPPACVRLVVVGNEPISPARVAAWRARVGDRVRLLNGYGLTESTITSTVGDLAAGAPATGSAPVGRPLAGVRAYVLSVLDGALEPVPPGVTGELHLAGDGLARGYLGNPAATAERFLPDPFAPAPGGGRLLRTGDLARMTGTAGDLEILGRADRQVKVRGHRVEPGEVEAVLAGHPEIQAAAVTVREDTPGDRRLVAYVVSRSAGADGAEDLERGAFDLWPTIGEYGVYDELMYDSMTSDEARNQAYREAIARVVPGKTVVDVGTGRDVLLARFAIAAGARKAYAIEVIDESYQVGRALLERLGLTDRIHLLHGDVGAAGEAAVTLPEPADVCISELIGMIGSSEGTVAYLNAARRLVKPDGVSVPSRCVTRIAGIELPAPLWRRPRMSAVPADYAARIFARVGRSFEVRLCTKGVTSSSLLSTAADFEDLHFDGWMEPEERREVTLEVERAGRLDGFLLWIQLWTAPGLLIDTLEREYCWLPALFPVFYPGVEVSRGDRIEMTCSRYLASHPEMPDYRVEGRLIRRTPGGSHETTFDYVSPWLGESSAVSAFHRAVFAADAPAAGPTPAGLRDYLAARLPAAMVPSAFVTLDSLPLAPSGKVDRQALPAPEATAPAASAMAAEREAPETPTEREVAAVWQDVLGTAPGARDDFFTLGGHSLKAVQVLSRLRAAFGIDLTLRDFFAAPTVRGLAARVEEALLGGSPTAELDALLDRLETGHA